METKDTFFKEQDEIYERISTLDRYLRIDQQFKKLADKKDYVRIIDLINDPYYDKDDGNAEGHNIQINILRKLIVLEDFEGFQIVAENFGITDFTIEDSIFLRTSVKCENEEQSYKFIKFFLDQGCDVQVNDNMCLKIAAREPDNFKIKKLLLDSGADIHAENDLVFRIACYSLMSAEDIKFWIDNGANIHVENEFGLRSYACYRDSVKNVMMYLVDCGADIHVNNDYIFRMTIKNDFSGVYTRELLNLGANFAAINADIVKYCIQYRNVESIKILKEYGYDFMSITHDLTNKNKEIITLLQEMNMDTMTILSIAMDKS